jgi:hypothetical protein
MEISGTGKQEAVSALVARIRAKARAKRASHLELLRILGDGTDQGVVGRDQAEAAGGHLQDGWDLVSFGQLEALGCGGLVRHSPRGCPSCQGSLRCT